MGYEVNMTAPEGDYYLITNSNHIYNLGAVGVAPFKVQSGNGITYL